MAGADASKGRMEQLPKCNPIKTRAGNPAVTPWFRWLGSWQVR